MALRPLLSKSLPLSLCTCICLYPDYRQPSPPSIGHYQKNFLRFSTLAFRPKP
jgi:hypothetical protein